MRSRGGEQGGLTLTEALAHYTKQGYGADFAPETGGDIVCYSCDAHMHADGVRLDAFARIEGASDPDDMALVGALACPRCGARGTAIFNYGPTAPPEHGEVLRLLQEHHERWQDVTAMGGPPERSS